jgi:hypothetical protein
VPDIIVGTGPGGASEIKVFDGRTAALLEGFFAFGGFSGGVFVAAGDVDRDGAADIIVGADAGGASEVQVFNGPNGALIRDFFAFGAFTGGVRVGSADINGDGFADIITAMGPGGPPEVRVFSGSTGAVVLDFFAFDGSFTGGIYVAGKAGAGGGFGAIIVGGAGEVRVFSGGNGGILADLFPYPNTVGLLAQIPTTSPAAGSVRVGASGINEFLTAAGPGLAPEVKALDAMSLATLADFFAFDSSFSGGVFIGGSSP